MHDDVVTLCLAYTLLYAECIIQQQPLPTTMNMNDLYKLRNDMAIQLLNASGICFFCFIICFSDILCVRT